MPTPVDTLIEARWLLPMAPRRRLLEDHAVAIRAGRIVGLAPIAEAQMRWQASDVVRLPRHALLPGLVNAHTHVAMNLFRGMADDLSLMDWLQGHIWPTEQRWVDPDFVRVGTRLACAEMIRGGTTCFNDMYFFPAETAETAVAMGLRASIGHVIIDFPTRYAQNAEEYLAKAEALQLRFSDMARVHGMLAPHAPYTVGDATLERVMALAARLDLPIHMHIHETAAEVAQSVEQYGLRPLVRLERLGFLSPRLLAVHMTQLDEAEIALCAARGVKVVHCPQSNLKLASGLAPVHRLLQAGVTVALGTDGAASNNDLDLLNELQTAALLAKAVAGAATALPAWDALEMATLNGARALGLEREIGSLEPGKAADCIAVDLDHPATQPLYSVASQLAYAAGRDQVSDVWVAGRRLLAGGAFTRLDWPALRDEAEQWRRRIDQNR